MCIYARDTGGGLDLGKGKGKGKGKRKRKRKIMTIWGNGMGYMHGRLQELSNYLSSILYLTFLKQIPPL